MVLLSCITLRIVWKYWPLNKFFLILHMALVSVSISWLIFFFLARLELKYCIFACHVLANPKDNMTHLFTALLGIYRTNAINLSYHLCPVLLFDGCNISTFLSTYGPSPFLSIVCFSRDNSTLGPILLGLRL